MLVLRILNGPLFGTDIVVPAEGCFVRVVDINSKGTDVSIEESLDQWSKDVVVTIPLPGGSSNFRLIPARNEQGDLTVDVEAYGTDTGIARSALALNEPFDVGALQCAVRPANEPWSDSVALHRNHAQQLSKPPVSALPTSRGRFRWNRLAATSSTVISAVIMAGLVWMAWPASAPAENVGGLLGDGSMQVVNGKNRQAYVFVDNADSVAGLSRRLMQAGVVNAQVRVRAHEAERIGLWLAASDMPYFAVDLHDPQHPLLRLRQMTSSEPVMPADLSARIRQIAPYVQAVQVQWRTEHDARRAAKFLVDEIGANATYRTTPRHFVAAVNDYLSDAQLQAFSRALDAYERVWGKDYARFEINQQDHLQLDGLKTGRFTYELRSARHIYFPPV